MVDQSLCLNGSINKHWLQSVAVSVSDLYIYIYVLFILFLSYLFIFTRFCLCTKEGEGHCVGLVFVCFVFFCLHTFGPQNKTAVTVTEQHVIL